MGNDKKKIIFEKFLEISKKDKKRQDREKNLEKKNNFTEKPISKKSKI